MGEGCTGSGASVTLPVWLVQEGSSHCRSHLRGFVSRGLLLGLLLPTSKGLVHELLSLLIMLFPPPPFPSSFALVNPLNSRCTLLKKKGTDEVQHPANGGVSAEPQNPTHAWGRQEGALLLGRQGWDPQAGSRPLLFPSHAELTVTEGSALCQASFRAPSTYQHVTPTLSDEL